MQSPIGERCGHRSRGNGDPYSECTEVVFDLRGGTGVIYFWDSIIMYVFYICVVGTDADTYVGMQYHKVLTQHERHKKDKYMEACLEQRQHFMPLVFSV